MRNIVRGYRRVQSSPALRVSEVVVPEVRTVVVPEVRTVVVPEVRTVVPQMKRVSGYRFNYLPVTEPFKPNIFASRVREAVSYGGSRVY